MGRRTVIELVLAASMSCPVAIGPGPHTVAALVCYEHESPIAPGLVWYAVAGGLYSGPVTIDVEAEGSPTGVQWIVSGLDAQTCGRCPTRFPPWIFADGFESGTLEQWSEVGP